MKTSNFPGMKQARRVGALARLEHQIEVLQLRESSPPDPWMVETSAVNGAIASKEREATKLRERIANMTWFTKKRRA